MTHEHAITHDFARDEVQVSTVYGDSIRITRYVGFGKYGDTPSNVSIELSPAQAAFVRDALNALMPTHAARAVQVLDEESPL